MKKPFIYSGIYLCLGALLWMPMPSFAQTVTGDMIPGAADAGRVERNLLNSVPPQRDDQSIAIPEGAPKVAVPDEAKDIVFRLENINVVGAGEKFQNRIAAIYKSYLNREISLAEVYGIADQITSLYRSEGYFLSIAYIPNQKISDGIVTINVVEGHIAEIDLGGGHDALTAHLLDGYADDLMAKRPVKSQDVESFLLRINDVPGLSFRAVLAPLKGAGQGATSLALVPSDKSGSGFVSVDNYGSRFLGPHEMFISYTKSLMPRQETTFSLSKSLPLDELEYLALDHSIAIAPKMTLQLGGSKTESEPGYTLSPFEIESKSTSLSARLTYQAIRQRDENLDFSIGIDGRNTTSDILGTALTRDYVRAIRASISYDTMDRWNGFNVANFTLSRGIDGLGSSDAGDLNLSRAEAEPDFTKAEINLSHLQILAPEWSVMANLGGQMASKALYSSEEFGYGGQAFGRAFDSSEITGDHGLAGSLELRYDGVDMSEYVSLQPFVFYDIGAVWNEDQGIEDRQSGASAGTGIRFTTLWQVSGSAELAFPLTREIENPIYGPREQGPRMSFRLTKAF